MTTSRDRRARRVSRRASAVLMLSGLLWSPTTTTAATSGANGTHDPSRMIESDGRFYVFSTGGGSKSSTDGLAWTAGPAMFPGGFPTWLRTLLPTNEGVWAPDIAFLNGQYYLFYAVAGLPATSACAIGLITSPTLNPSSPSYKWTDRGLVVQNTANNSVITYAAIDPGPVLDAEGNLWLVWGGGYANPTTAQSIWLTRLDNTTGLPSTADPAYKPPTAPGHPLELGHKEGPYVHYHSGFYYLFWQTGSCCSGAASTYTINMARSSSITGPYTGDRVFDASRGSIHGPGHIGIYNACGVERFTYHYYPDTGGSVLGENELSWSADGWPVMGPESTTPLKPCGASGNGGASGSGGASGDGGSVGTGGTPGRRDGGTNGIGGAGSGGFTGGGTGAGGAIVGAGGGPGSAGASGEGGAAGSSDGGTTETPAAGCGCEIRGGSRLGGGGAALFLLVGLILVVRRRCRH